jgi:hypothetical protein
MGAIVKYKGKTPTALFEKILVLPRSDRYVNGVPEEDIILRFKPVSNWEDFTKVCPEPICPKIQIAGQEQRDATADEAPEYGKRLRVHNLRQTQWLVINSISATTDLTFENVKLDQPETWGNFDKELLEGGFNIFEIQKIYNFAMEANVLTDEALNAARERFLATERARVLRSSSPTDVLSNTQSGVPVKELASSPQESKTTSTT